MDLDLLIGDFDAATNVVVGVVSVEEIIHDLPQLRLMARSPWYYNVHGFWVPQIPAHLEIFLGLGRFSYDYHPSAMLV